MITVNPLAAQAQAPGPGGTKTGQRHISVELCGNRYFFIKIDFMLHLALNLRLCVSCFTFHSSEKAFVDIFSVSVLSVLGRREPRPE